MERHITRQRLRSGKGVRDAAGLDEHAGMPKTARKRGSRDATLGGMNQHHHPRPVPHPPCGKASAAAPADALMLTDMDSENFPHQAHASAPETCKERIAKINAAAAVQIARAAAGQPTGWTLLSAVAHWLMARVDVLLEQAS